MAPRLPPANGHPEVGTGSLGDAAAGFRPSIGTPCRCGCQGPGPTDMMSALRLATPSATKGLALSGSLVVVRHQHRPASRSLCEISIRGVPSWHPLPAEVPDIDGVRRLGAARRLP